MRFGIQINLLIGLVVGLATGLLIGAFQWREKAEPRVSQDEVQVRKIDIGKRDAIPKKIHGKTGKSFRSVEALRGLALTLQLHSGKIDEVKSGAIQDVRAYYLDFGPGAVVQGEHDAFKQMIIFRIERAASRWPELELIPIPEGEQAGAGEPTTRPESDSEGGDKPEPEAVGRSR
jgi:hypothetical protein